MQTSHAITAGRFDGTFNSQGGSQFLGNHFSTDGAPIHFGANPVEEPPATICDLPDFLLSPLFTGRGDELQQIDSMFNISSGDLPARYIIHGMPGLGKTQLALKFATRAFQKNQYPYVFWVSGASVEKLSQDVSKMVDLLRLPGWQTLVQASKLTTARAWLEDSSAARSWLIVLDNVREETAAMLGDILPRRGCKGRLLMTTRTATIAELFSTSEALSQMALQPPGIGDAVAMLSAGAKMKREGREESSREDAERLVRSVGNLPLAIDQAASYMRETGGSPREVLDVYASDEVPEMLLWENDLSQHEEKSVMATFTPALNRVQQTAPDVETLLRIFCFCDPESIPISIFTQGCDALDKEDKYPLSRDQAVDKPEHVRGLGRSLRRMYGALRQKRRHHRVRIQRNDKLDSTKDLFQSPIRLSKALQELQRLSLAAQAFEGADQIVRIHDLVQLLLRSKFTTDGEGRQWLEVAMCVICKAFNEIDDHTSPHNWKRCGLFISHIESLGGFAEQYALEKMELNELLNASTSAGQYLDACGLFEKAATLDRRTLAMKEKTWGKRDPSTLVSMNNLAAALASLGKYEEAERINRQALTSRKLLLGKKHPDTLSSKINLALVLGGQGKYEEAESMHRETLALSESVLGEKHPDTLRSMHDLAGILSEQRKYKEAERIYRETLALSEPILGEKHPDTLRSMHNLAVTLKRQGKYEEAEKKNRQILPLLKSVLGKEHPHTLLSKNNLAELLKEQGRYEEAERIYRETLALRESVLGKEHLDTLDSVYCLAHLLHSIKLYEDAEPMYQRACDGLRVTLGDSHPFTIRCSRGYASMRQEANGES